MKIYPENQKQWLFRLLHNLLRYFKMYGVSYTASGGTLLGAVREGGWIKHDYDIDLDIHQRSRKPFFKLVHFLRANPKLGLGVTLELPTMVKFSPVVQPDTLHEFNTPGVPNATVDCFILERTPRGWHRIVAGAFPKWHYKKGELFPLRKLFFDNILISVPNRPRNILRRYYNDWETPTFKAWPADDYEKSALQKHGKETK